MSSSAINTEAFIAKDQQFISRMDAVRLADPLGMRTGDAIFAFQGSDTEPSDEAIKAAVDSVTAISSELTDAESPNYLAARRDFDKVIGRFTAKKTVLRPDVQDAANIFMTAGASPRADFYSYSIGNNLDKAGTYTGDDREIRLIEIFGTSVSAAHLALRSVLRSRDALKRQDKDEAGSQLEAARGFVHEMHLPMIATYREVGPDFVPKVTRYLGPVKMLDQRHEGPNPSHSAFFALDRFVYGDFKPLVEKQPFLREHFSFRVNDNMPTHLRELMNNADATADNQGLVELTAAEAPEYAGIATDIATQIRKFKTVHKSYADKALKAKGEVLTTEEPDVLSEAIKHARQKES